MAKEKKVKVETKEPAPIEQPKEELSVETTPEVGDTPPSVTLDEVNEPEPAVEAIPEPVITPSTEGKALETETTQEQKIIAFVESRGSGEVRLNEFIKSLYPPVNFANPPQYLELGENKRIRNMLAALVSEGHFAIQNDLHLRIASIYYDGDGKCLHHNINTLPLVAIR